MRPTDLQPLAGNERLLFLDLELKPLLHPYKHSVTRNGKSEALPPPEALTVEKYGGEIILWHWAADGTSQSHNHVDEIEDAIEYANYLFGAVRADWSDV